MRHRHPISFTAVPDLRGLREQHREAPDHAADGADLAAARLGLRRAEPLAKQLVRPVDQVDLHVAKPTRCVGLARWVIVAACAAACGAPAKNPAPAPSSSLPSPLAAEAVAGVSDPALRAVLADHWEHQMRWAPTWATTLGDHRYDDQLWRV